MCIKSKCLNNVETGKMHSCVILFLAVAAQAKRKSAHYEQVNRKPANLEANVPIPFGNIDIHGFGDPRFNQKQPIDLLDYAPSVSRDNYGGQFKEPIKEDTKPPDERTDDDIQREGGTNTNNTIPVMAYDYTRTLENNLARRSKTQQQPKPVFKDNNNEDPRAFEFIDGTFRFPQTRIRPINRTMCSEFAKKAYFHPKQIVNMDWVPFYIWYDSNSRYGLLHTFQFPKREDVRHFKEDIGIYVNRTIDWTAPKLLMSEMRNHMLIAADQRGLFIDVPDHSVPDYVKRRKAPVSSLVLRMKIVDKYLAVLYCDINYAFIMAVPENIPETDEMKTEEAAKLKLRGEGNPVIRDLKFERQLEENRVSRLNFKPKMLSVDEPIPPIMP